MEITTPLGADVLLFYGMHAREEMSRLSEFQIDLLSAKNDVKLDDILGKNVTVSLGLPDNSTRYFNGFVTRFAQGGTVGRYHHYHAMVRPWLWFLTRTADCRIFQEMTVPDILKKVLGEDPHADFAFELTGSYRKWTYCVQYRETDFNFVSRLMEEEGIYYYFRHTDGHNTMVLTDSTSKHVAAPGCGTLPYLSSTQAAAPNIDHVSSWDFAREIHSVAFVHTDYDFERPKVKLETQKTLPRPTTPGVYEVFDYPGSYLQKPDGTQLAAVRMDEIGTQYEAARAATNARGLTTGCLLKLERFPRADQNREYLVLSSRHDLQFSEYEGIGSGRTSEYRCSFVAMSSGQQFRPARTTPKPFVQGPQTAVVVGPSGDQIYTDKFGRVKVQFHWDRYGKNDQDSSCWIRVSHPWAGKGWGSVSTPRIGQEVIVDFLEGDPDQPIITGRVYNDDNQPPFGFPAGAVTSGIKSDTHKGKGYDEMSMDDTAGKEKITVHGQYDMNTTVEHDQTNTVNNTFTETIKNDTKITITAGPYSHDVAANTATYHVKGALAETYDDTQTTTVNKKIAITSATNEIVINGATQITLVTGSSQLVMKADGTISLTGKKITIIGNDEVGVSSAKTSVAGSSEAKFGTGNQSVTTDPAKVAVSGASINSSATGVHEITGAVVKIN
jgi:type VI secretion system secreted protein VgrG